MLFCATRDNVRRLHVEHLNERGFAVVALSGEHSQTERNQALQALRDGRARVLRRDRRRRARHRPAEPEPGRPCRAAARRRDAPAPLGPHRPRRQEGHRGADRPLSAPQAGRDDAARRADRGRVDRRRRPPRTSAPPTMSGCSTALLAPVEVDEEDRELGARLLAEQSARGDRRRAGPRPPRAPARARGADRRPLARRARRQGRRATAPASRTSSGSGWTSAAATMPTRAGCCPCCAAAATSPATRSARSASPRTRPASRSRARWRSASPSRSSAPPGAEGEGEVTIIVAEGPPGPMDRGDHGANIRPDQRPRPRTGPGPRSGPPPGARDHQALRRQAQGPAQAALAIAP